MTFYCKSVIVERDRHLILFGLTTRIVFTLIASAAAAAETRGESPAVVDPLRKIALSSIEMLQLPFDVDIRE